MPETYKQTTKTSWFSRIGGSIKGIFFGFLLFIASFVVLYWNEGRVDLSNIAATAVPVDATAVLDSSLDGKLVAASGILNTSEQISDGKYLRASNYLSVQRIVEMYAWVEKSTSETKTKLGGSQETTTEYTYEKEWTNAPADSGSFKVPTGHTNPQKFVDDTANKATGGTLGNLTAQINKMGLVGSEDLGLTAQNTNLGRNEKIVDEKYIFSGRGTMESPWVGDLRIKFVVVPSGQEVTVFGKLEGDKLVTFIDKDGNILYRAFYGDLESAVGKLAGEHKTSTWILRVIGFLLMWFGLMVMFAPLSVLLDVLPILGSISRTAVKFVMFLASLVLSAVTIIISMVFHNIWAVIIVVVIVAGGLGFMIKKKLGEKKDGVEKKSVEPEVKVEKKEEKTED